MSETGTLLGLFFLSIGFSALFSATETALFAVPRSRLRRLAARGGTLTPLLRRVAEKPQRVFAGVLLANTLAAVSAAATLALVLQRSLGSTMHPNALLVVQVVSVTFLLLVLGELAPKTYALARGETAALRLAGFLRFAEPILRPAAHVVGAVALFLTRLAGGSGGAEPAAEELQALIEEGRKSGTFSEHEARILSGAFRLRRLAAADVMIPRADLIAVPVESTAAQLVELLGATGHSRIPVYEGTLDRIVGVVEASDLLPFVLDRAQTGTVRELLKPPVVVPPTRSLEELLLAMQRQRLQFVLVVTPAGETLGIVSLEDVVEELVGEIESEFDAPEASVRIVGPGEAVVRGNVRVSDLNRLIGTHLPSENGSTVEALVTSLWAAPPTEGESRRAGGGETLTVESMVGGRVWSVRIARGSRERAS